MPLKVIPLKSTDPRVTVAKIEIQAPKKEPEKELVAISPNEIVEVDVVNDGAEIYSGAELAEILNASSGCIVGAIPVVEAEKKSKRQSHMVCHKQSSVRQKIQDRIDNPYYSYKQDKSQ